MVLCSQQARFRTPPHLPLGFQPGLGVVAGAAVLPHYDRFPETLAAVRVARAPRGTVILGIDEDTAAIGRDGPGWSAERAGSRSGAAATANDIAPGTRSGSDPRGLPSCQGRGDQHSVNGR